jgi:Na+/H+ antiporter NhaD/arsenite permease-like protein
MIAAIIISIFFLGYLAIVFEHSIHINKAASALITGVLCWTIYILSVTDATIVNAELLHHFGEIASILFFLLGAMVIVEVVDAHDGFSIITDRIKTTNKGKLLIILSFVAFFLSSLLDNLTTTIVMVSIAGKILSEKEDRWYFAGMIVIAANAGGAWSPLGDVTSTMLWIGGQISAPHIIKALFIPSIVCMAIPMTILWMKFRNENISLEHMSTVRSFSDSKRKIMFFSGLLALLFVPAFKSVTHLPPFMGMMLALGIIWAIVNYLQKSKKLYDGNHYSLSAALHRIDNSSILFFLGILLAISALESVGILKDVALWLAEKTGSIPIIGIIFGLLSSLIDNVPLVAATQGMYDLHVFPQDHLLWTMIVFCTGTGGSALIIGSAAGVAAMGMEDINFIWYVKKIGWLALVGFFAGTVSILLFQ